MPRRKVTADEAISASARRYRLKTAKSPPLLKPERRRLRVYAYDPSLETGLETLGFNDATIDVRWEDGLKPGPIGEYIEVVDVDPFSKRCYAPVDLNNPYLLVRDGLPPSEANPLFHQQMVYAVAMKTIEHFERALGRVALWSASREHEFIRCLRIFPHALREENAYYSPQRKALLFGYFPSSGTDKFVNPEGTLVFTCLSYDIIAHETTHALLDGLHRRYRLPSSNADMAAFHEAFADLVALFQHFTVPEALRNQIAKARGDLTQHTLLAQLAIQFGSATSGRGALRDYIGELKENGEWAPRAPRDTDYSDAAGEPHALGAVLVSAVFEAFVEIYTMRAEELILIATGGSGRLPEGALPSVLVDRLAREASKIAAQFLQICIRALDYCPPVELSFGDFLRAVITADRDIVPDDRRSYRVALVSAFRKRGIAAEGVRHLSVGSLVWEPPPKQFKHLGDIIAKMKPKLTWDLNADRETAWNTSTENAWEFWRWLKSRSVSEDEIAMLGLQRSPRATVNIAGVKGRLGRMDVHSFRPATRVTLDGRTRSDVVVELTQNFFPADGSPKARGGVTLLIDLETHEMRYLIRKKVASAIQAQKEHRPYFAIAAQAGNLRKNYFTARSPYRHEAFAIVHRSFAGHER